LLFARAAQLYCRQCASRCDADSTESIIASLAARTALAGDPRLTVTFRACPENFGEDEVRGHLEAQGGDTPRCTLNAAQADAKVLDVVSDRFPVRRH